MKSITLIIMLMILMLPVAGFTADDWNKEEISKEVAWMVLHAVDWRQTAYAMDRPDEYEELNPILGNHPSEGRLNMFMLTTALGHYLITKYIPKEHRSVWQNISIGFKLGTVSSNYYVGARIKW